MLLIWRTFSYVVVEGVVDYYCELELSSLPCVHLVWRSPDDENEWWYVEAVEVDGELVAIRQVTIEANGDGHRYSTDRIEDDWDGLTDQAIDYEEQPERRSASLFEEAWGRSGRPSAG